MLPLVLASPVLLPSTGTAGPRGSGNIMLMTGDATGGNGGDIVMSIGDSSVEQPVEP